MHKPLHIGSFDRRLTIQEQAAQTTGFPDPEAGWTNLYTNVPAKRMVGNGNETEKDGSLEYKQEATYTIRYVSGLTRNHRVVEEGISYHITDIKELGTRSGLQLTCLKI